MTVITPSPGADGPDASGPLPAEELRLLDASWRTANFLPVGQIYLPANPLPREPLLLEHVKPRLLGHWATTPGLNLTYAHLNRVIQAIVTIGGFAGAVHRLRQRDAFGQGGFPCADRPGEGVEHRVTLTPADGQSPCQGWPGRVGSSVRGAVRCA
jgi:hypothetical protein